MQDLIIKLKLLDEMTAPLRNALSTTKQFTGTVSTMTSGVNAAQNALNRLKSFAKLRDEITKSNQKMDEARERVRKLHTELQKGNAERTAKQMQRLRQEYDSARRTAEQLERTHARQRGRLASLNSELSKAGINTRQLASEQSRLSKEMERQEKLLKRKQEIQAQTEKSREGWQNIRDKSAMVAMGGMAAISVPIKASIDFESSMADVKKVVDFGDNPTVAAAGLKQMSDEIIKLSTIYPMAAKDIATIVAAGGQSGIAKNELTKFAADAIQMGVAFDTTAEQAGQSMAELRTAFAMNQTEVVELADKINYLGNNTPAAAKSIMEIVQRIGPLGEVGGLASGSIAALGATMKGMGIAEEIAATGIKNMMLALVKGETATDAQKQAFAKLGLSHTEIAKKMQTDSEGTISSVLSAIAKLEKHEQASMLNTLFGSESLGAIAPLLTQLDSLEANFDKVGKAGKYAGSMNAEYAARANTTANKIQLMKQKGEALALKVGEALLPALNELIGFASDIIDRFSAWANANPELFSMLSKGAAIVVGLAAALSGLAAFMLTIIGPLALLKAAFATLGGLGTAVTFITKIGTAISWLGGLVKTVGMAMMANPILIVIAAIAAAAYLIYQNWGSIKPFLLDIWNSIKTYAQTGIEFIKTVIMNFSPVGLFIQAFTAVFTYLSGLGATFMQYGANLIEGLKNGIMGRVEAVVSAIRSVVGRIKSAFTGAKGMDIHSPSRVFKAYGGFMMQGLDQGLAGNAKNVINTTQGITNKIKDGMAHVTPNRTAITGAITGGQGASMAGATPASIVININGATDPQATAKAVQAELARWQANQAARDRRRLTD